MLPLLVCLHGCKNSEKTDQQKAPSIFSDSSFTIEQLYNLASKRDAKTLMLTDSILNSTSDQNARSEAFYIKGLYYTNINLPDQALEYFDASIRENYTQVDAYIEKGILLCNKNKFEAAIETLEIALQLTKNNTDLYYWLGKSFEGLNNIHQAHKWYELALSIEPEFEEAKKAFNRTK
jgi:tetratricopeptide (TPR) repeat protein